MSQTKKRSFLKTFFVIFALLFFVFNGFSWIYHNHGETGYEDDGESSRDKSSSIKAFIIEGAGYFLNGYSDVLILLNRIEVAEQKGLDYHELQEIVDRALTNLYRTKMIYSQLIASAENTPYNKGVIEKLITFDYESFMENNGLIPFIFKEVETCLKKGDITGIFKKSFANFDNIIALLKTIREEIDYGKIPKTANLWELNQLYAGELLFGQYAAQIFNIL
jgi:hypothetical protein